MKPLLVLSNVAADERNGAGMRVLIHYLHGLAYEQVVSIHFGETPHKGTHGLKHIAYHLVPRPRHLISLYQKLRQLVPIDSTVLVLPNDGQDLILGLMATLISDNVTVWIMDDFISASRTSGLTSILTRTLKSLMMRALFRRARKTIVIAESMRTAYSRRFGRKADEVIGRTWKLSSQPVHQRPQQTNLKFAWMGHYQKFYSEPLQQLSEISQNTTTFQIDIYGSREVDQNLLVAERLTYKGGFTEDQTLAILADYDYGLITYSWDDHTRKFMALSLPGKLSDYLCAGLPIIYIGPPELEAARFIRVNELGLVITTNDREAIKAELETCPRPGSEQYQQWVRRAIEVAHQQFEFTGALERLKNTLLDSYT
jgi:hypothetical protein